MQLDEETKQKLKLEYHTENSRRVELDLSREHEIPYHAELLKRTAKISQKIPELFRTPPLRPFQKNHVEVQTRISVRGLYEFNTAISQSLNVKCYSAVEALTRCTLEHAANLLYMYEGDIAEKCAWFINSGVRRIENEADKRIRFGKESRHSVSVRTGEQVNELYTPIRNNSGIPKQRNNTKKDKGRNWPKALSLFQALGMESAYRNLYDPASDSVHSLSADTTNYIIGANLPEDARETFAYGLEAERMSYAVYMAFQALHYYILALLNIAKAFESNLEKELLILYANTHGVLCDHDSDSLRRSHYTF